MRAPLMKAQQDGSIRIHDLPKVVMGRRRLGLAEERLVPPEAGWNVAYADDRPGAFHRSCGVGSVSLPRLRLKELVLHVSQLFL